MTGGAGSGGSDGGGDAAGRAAGVDVEWMFPVEVHADKCNPLSGSVPCNMEWSGSEGLPVSLRKDNDGFRPVVKLDIGGIYLPPVPVQAPPPAPPPLRLPSSPPPPLRLPV